jgi:hypothetical protein
MRWNPSHPDPHRDLIDAVLSGEPLDEDLLDVAAIVHDIRSSYLPVTSPSHDSGLPAAIWARLDTDADLIAGEGSTASSATCVGLTGNVSDAEPRGRKRDKMLSTVSGFVGTLTGKMLLGTAVTAASVGGLHAADVVDIPALPGNDRPAAQEQSGGGDADPQAASSDAAAAGQQTAAEKQAAAQAYADAVRDWTDCVAEAAAAQGDAESRVTGEFDPREHCGERPLPEDYGLTDLPSQAADAAKGSADGTPAESLVPDAGSTAPGDPGGDPTDGGSNVPAPGGQGGDDPTNRGSDVPAPGSNAPTGGGGPAGGQP